MSKINMSKVKSKLTGIKDQIENEEDRKKQADDLLRDQETRLNNAQEEEGSFKRRIQLVLEDKERADKTYNERAQKLEETKQRFYADEELRTELENTDRGNDDEITRLEARIGEATQNAEEAEEKLSEVMQKLKVVAIELQKAYERVDMMEGKVDKLEMHAQSQGEQIRDLEERDSDAVDKEQDCEQMIALIQEELDEKLQRIEDAERKVPPLDLYMIELIAETQVLRKQMKATEEEFRSMADCGDDSDDELAEKNAPAEPEPEPESEPQPEPEPEPEPENDEPEEEHENEVEEPRESDDDEE